MDNLIDQREASEMLEADFKRFHTLLKKTVLSANTYSQNFFSCCYSLKQSYYIACSAVRTLFILQGNSLGSKMQEEAENYSFHPLFSFFSRALQITHFGSVCFYSRYLYIIGGGEENTQEIP